MQFLPRQFLFVFLALFSALSAAAERTTYLVPDAQGSPVAAMDEQGNVIWRETYAPYGARLNRDSANDGRTAYTGKPEDSGTGLVYMGARWYDPETGRFTGMDPQGFSEGNPQSFGRYLYGNNSPYVYLDPNGELPILAPLVVMLAKEGAGLAVESATGVSVPFTMKGLAKAVAESGQDMAARGARAALKSSAVRTRHGDALQGADPVSMAARDEVSGGANLYKLGTLGKSDVAESQFWALRSPGTKGYADGYGIPPENLENANFIAVGSLRKGTEFVTRPAPGVGGNAGGWTEVVVPPGGVKVKSFSMSPPDIK